MYSKMLLFFCLLVFLSHHECSTDNLQENDYKELQLVFLIHRHGERTPDEDEMSLSNMQDKLRNLTALDGYEALTMAGKRRGYQLGKFIRQRYGAQGLRLISNLYDPDEISVRSTDKDRTKMMALTAMAAVYPPKLEQQWGEGIGKVWQPVPYDAVPLKLDYLRYYSNCKAFSILQEQAKQNALAQEFAPYKDLIAKASSETGRNFTKSITLFQTLYDLYKSQVNLGIHIPEWAKLESARLEVAAKMAYKTFFRTREMKKIGGGVLLSNFMKIAEDIISGSPVPKRLRIFSAHDYNVGAFMEVTKVNNSDTIPEYGAVFALELYRAPNGDFSVLPIYLNQAGDSLVETLVVEGCEEYCEFTKFQNLIKEYLLTEHDFYRICGIKAEL